MPGQRLHTRLHRPDVEVDSPLIECRLLDLSTAGIGFETNVGLRLGVPYPLRLRDGEQTLAIEAVVRWCRLVRNEIVEGEPRPIFRAGASFVDWQPGEPAAAAVGIEQQIEQAIDGWIERSQAAAGEAVAERKIVHQTRRGQHW